MDKAVITCAAMCDSVHVVSLVMNSILRHFQTSRNSSQMKFFEHDIVQHRHCHSIMMHINDSF